MFIKICGLTFNTDSITYIEKVTVYPRRKMYYDEYSLTKEQKADQTYTEFRMRIHIEAEKCSQDLNVSEDDFYKYFRRAMVSEENFVDLDAAMEHDAKYRKPTSVGRELPHAHGGTDLFCSEYVQ